MTPPSAEAPNRRTCFAYEARGKVGYVDASGAEIAPASWDNGVHESAGGLVAVQRDGRWGFLRADGRVITEPIFEHAEAAYCFREERAFVMAEGQWLLIDDTGHIIRRRGVDPPSAGSRYEYFEGLAAVGLEGTGRWLDRSGQIIGPAAYAQTRRFADGRAAVAPRYAPRKWGYANSDGELVVEPRYSVAGHFSQGRAPVALGTHWGYIDGSGAEVIEPRFNAALPFDEERAFVRRMRSWAIIDRDGQVKGKARFAPPRAKHATLGLLQLYADSDAWDQLPVKPLHARGGPDPLAPRFRYRFSEGLAAVCVDGAWGYVDREGEWAIPPRYLLAGGFTRGRAVVVEGEGGVPTDWSIIDPQGAPVGDVAYDRARRCSSAGVTMVRDEEGERLIDLDGETLWPRRAGLLSRLKGLFRR